MIRIVKIGPGATVQDLGRPGHMHEGVPPGGPLVPELMQAANASLGNEPNAAVLEIPNGAVVSSTSLFSVDGIVHSDATVEIRSETEAVRYLAVPGGIDVPVVRGSRGTLLVAGLGGHEGRMLRAGDLLRVGGGTNGVTTNARQEPPRSTIRVVLGPDAFSSPAIDCLLQSEFIVGPADRVGMRLNGARLPVTGDDPVGSMPMVRGAIQVTRDGTPIVLGPDHPTTGGYRVIAAVVSTDWGALARRRTGSAVRFERAT